MHFYYTGGFILTHQEIAAALYQLLGPKNNILSVENCMTRLRLILKDRTQIDLKSLQQISGVLGINESGQELQIILGPGKVTKVKEAFDILLHTPPPKQVNNNTVSPVQDQSCINMDDGEILHQKIRQKNSTPFKLFLKKISSIFLPLIPAFIACGLITGLLNIALKLMPGIEPTATVQILKIAGNAVFWGINLFVGVNAAKEFGASPMIGGTMAAIITHPALSQITLFGQDLLPGRGGIIAVLLVTAFSSWLEKNVRPRVPELLELFLTPLLVILISTFAAILFLQPLGGIISEAIGFAATNAIEQGGAFTGFILGGTFLPLVMTGLHQGLTPIHAELLARSGVTILLPVLAMAGAGQVGASLAVYAKTKNSRLKRTIASALPVGIMGIGEPLIYGVTLPLGKPFIGACFGGAFGGAIQAFNMVGATSIGLSGLPLAASTDHILSYLAGLITAYSVGFIATWLIGFQDPEL